ncbi:MAG TPA: ABC transporter permease [Bryobacteraceae bacterium]|nr:ABC transporter permease [Bryobacteraceae bacterium]
MRGFFERSLDRIRFRLRTLFHRAEAESELDAEMRFHLENLIEQKRAAGMSAAEARDAARREMGSIGLYKEECRDSLGVRLLSDLWQDIGYGLRVLRQSPGFTAVAVLSLALGIGANTAIFTLLDSVVLRQLPVKNPGELMQLELQTKRRPMENFSYAFLQAVERVPDLFESVFTQRDSEFTIGPGGDASPIRGAYVTGNYFDTLGISPFIGRTISTSDDAGENPVTVLSYPFWVDQFGSDRSITNRTIIVNGAAVRIVGVLPKNFTGVNVGAVPAFYVPLRLEPVLAKDRSMLKKRTSWWLAILARPRPGVTQARAQAILQAAWPSLLKEAFDPRDQNDLSVRKPFVIDASRGFSGIREDFSRPLYYLMGISGLVLLIACANIANLLLARTKARQHEIATRLALGASRFRVLRQLMTESLLLSGAGAAIGLLIASPCSRLLVSLISEAAMTVWLDVTPDLRILSFATLLALLTGLLFGAAPALSATSDSVRDTPRTATRHTFFGKALVVSQVSLSLLLLIAAGLFARTFWNLTHQDLGFEPRNVYTGHIDPRDLGIKDDALRRLYGDLNDKLNHEPGLQTASLAMMSPVAYCCWGEDLQSAESLHPEERTNSAMNMVAPGYFATFTTPILLGRDFSPDDDARHPLAAIVDAGLAKHLFGAANPIGRHISVLGDKNLQNVEIIGLAKDANQQGLRKGVEYTAYFSVLQSPHPEDMLIAVRSNENATAVQTSVARIVHSVSPQTPVTLSSFEAQIGDQSKQDRLTAILSNFFGLLAVSLVCIGLYGLMSYTVARRTGEIGIRMALGAEGGRVRWMVLREALVMAGAGIAIGVPCAVACAKMLSSLQDMLFGLKASDPATVAATAVLLLGVAAVAGFLPAHRATRIEPMVALRHE